MRHPPARIYIGCSGWSYRHWRERFYPATLPATRWFAHYAHVFDTVELNNSFYHLPSAAAVERWRAQAPAAFIFAVKASRYLTHMRKLKDAEAGVHQFIERIRGLGPHLGPVLYQLPPRWHCDVQRLETFLRLLPRDLQHVFEFREPSWICDAVFAVLERHRAALCVHDMPGSNVPRRAVGPIAYVRFHGAGARYGGGYPDALLADWAQWLRRQAAGRRPAFVYFNNDIDAHAVADAQRLRELLQAQVPAGE